MSKLILVVEDDFDTLNPLAELLRLRGYTVITASEVDRAINIARQRRPDLIITDIVLPGKSGLHFISTIRNDKIIAATPVVVISGCGPMILVEAESAGADFCLEKPISIDKFWATIDHVLGEAQNRRYESATDAIEMKQAPASEIDKLVESLRHCSTRDEREAVLKQLKREIMQMYQRKTNSA